MEKHYNFVFVYICIFVLSLIIVTASKFIKNMVALSFLVSVILFILFIVLNKLNVNEMIVSGEKTSIRYTMHCRDCGWEWMSNVSDKIPTVCPNCHSKEKSELVGWRKVRPSDGKQKERDLRNFFKI